MRKTKTPYTISNHVDISNIIAQTGGAKSNPKPKPKPNPKTNTKTIAHNKLKKNKKYDSDDDALNDSVGGESDNESLSDSEMTDNDDENNHQNNTVTKKIDEEDGNMDDDVANVNINADADVDVDDEADGDDDNKNANSDDEYSNIDEKEEKDYIVDEETLKSKCYSKYAKVDYDELDFDELFGEETLIINTNSKLTKPILTKYEFVRLLTDRSKQLAQGAKPMIKNISGLSSKEIAKLELKNKIIPLIIERPIPNSVPERWKLTELEIPEYFFTN